MNENARKLIYEYVFQTVNSSEVIHFLFVDNLRFDNVGLSLLTTLFLTVFIMLF